MRSVCPCYIWWKLNLEGKAGQKTVLWFVITKAYGSSNKVSALCITLSQTQNHFHTFLQSQHLLVYAMFFINYFHWYKNRLHHDIFILIGLISRITFPFCHRQCYWPIYFSHGVPAPLFIHRYIPENMRKRHYVHSRSPLLSIRSYLYFYVIQIKMNILYLKMIGTRSVFSHFRFSN